MTDPLFDSVHDYSSGKMQFTALGRTQISDFMSEMNAFYTADAMFDKIVMFANGKIASLEIEGAPSTVFPASSVVAPMLLQPYDASGGNGGEAVFVISGGKGGTRL